MAIRNKKIITKQEIIIATIIIAITSSIIVVASNTQFQQEIRKESLAATGMEPDNAEKTVLSPKQTFWINTVRLDGNASINGDLKPMYQPEKFPNSPLSTGGGFILTPPNNAGDWSIRSFTFDPSMIVVHQGD